MKNCYITAAVVQLSPIRRLYVSYRNLQKIKPTCDTRGSTRSKEASSTSSRLIEDFCIFCDKKTKYLKGVNTREKLCQSLELRSDTTVRNAALKKINKILALT